MSVIEKSREVSHGQAQLFALVNDTESYPLFVPYCSAGRVVSVENQIKIAELDFSAMGFTQTLCTRNRLHPHSQIDVELVSGPLKSLEGYWRFEQLSDHRTLVQLRFELEFAGGFMFAAIEPILAKVLTGLVDDFCEYADKVYHEG